MRPSLLEVLRERATPERKRRCGDSPLPAHVADMLSETCPRLQHTFVGAQRHARRTASAVIRRHAASTAARIVPCPQVELVSQYHAPGPMRELGLADARPEAHASEPEH